MRRPSFWLLLSCSLAVVPRGSSGAELPNGLAAFASAPAVAATRPAVALPKIPNGPSAFAPRIVTPIDDRSLAGAIDRLIAAKWAAAAATPAPPAGDAEFLRRVALDVAGRIPTASEARAFLASTDPGKRRKVVETLLSGPAFANHLMNVWTDLLIPEAAGSFQVGFFAPDFEVWLRKQFAEGVGYDKLVRELLTVPVQNGQQIFSNNGMGKPSSFAFLAAKDGKPENFAASTSRLFLGIRLECAQCHNHPFAKWKREEFWGMAAFFAGVQRQGSGDALFQGTDAAEKHEIEMAGTKRVIQASFLDGRDLEWTKASKARAVLAEWVTARDNPYFARAAVNRIWAQFFGIGLIDPVDDMGANVEASHPELLDLLADQFAAHAFDLKYMIRTITSSRVYQLTSAGDRPRAMLTTSSTGCPCAG